MKSKRMNPPQIIMFLFMVVLLIATVAVDISMVSIVNDALIK